jgi:lipoprotein-anchoring transpeptidase ErfK/SrfK
VGGRFLKAVLLAAGLIVAAGSVASASIIIDIDKVKQRMTVRIDGTLKYTWPVSTGKPGYATPSGTFSVFRMEKTYASKEWDNAPMPHTMFFTPAGNAIHGTYESAYLGRPVSHGCVRLALQNAATLFSLIQSQGMFGAEVVITGPSPGLPPGARREQPHNSHTLVSHTLVMKGLFDSLQ